MPPHSKLNDGVSGCHLLVGSREGKSQILTVILSWKPDRFLVQKSFITSRVEKQLHSA